MPPKEFIKKAGKFNRIFNKAWCTFFLYPRKIVYYDEKETDPNYKKANYIAVLKNWGIDKIKYKITSDVQYGVFPISK